MTDQWGPPRVEGTRLDGEGEASGDAGGYATSMGDSGNTLNWWPTSVEFPSLGCWEITETVGDTSITYVVKL